MSQINANFNRGRESKIYAIIHNNRVFISRTYNYLQSEVQIADCDINMHDMTLYQEVYVSYKMQRGFATY